MEKCNEIIQKVVTNVIWIPLQRIGVFFAGKSYDKSNIINEQKKGGFSYEKKTFGSVTLYRDDRRYADGVQHRRTGFFGG